MKIFNSVAQMKLAFLIAGQIVSTSGYYAPGDGGQAEYLIKANEAVDGFGNHDLAGTTVAILQDRGTPNVWQFGAVHDGVSDDTAFFDAAWLASNPIFVEVPAASYEIPGTVTGSFYSFGVVTIVTGNVDTIVNTGNLASATLQGIVELATQAEVDAGVDAERVITPVTLSSALAEESGTFVTSYIGFTAPIDKTWTYVKRGSLVTIHTPQWAATSNATQFISVDGDVPVFLRPATTKMGLFIIMDNGTFVAGTIDINASSGRLSFGSANLNGLGGFQASGSKGYRGDQTFTYSLID